MGRPLEFGIANHEMQGRHGRGIATEILNNGLVEIDGSASALTCCRLRDVKEISDLWKPKRGIYCDDLLACAESHGKKLMFLVEVKGTTLEEGLSHSMEAKIFYQLARTCVTLANLMPSGPCCKIAGAVTVAIIHSWRKITINVLDEIATRGYFPDRWFPPGERY